MILEFYCHYALSPLYTGRYLTELTEKQKMILPYAILIFDVAAYIYVHGFAKELNKISKTDTFHAVKARMNSAC